MKTLRLVVATVAALLWACGCEVHGRHQTPRTEEVVLYVDDHKVDCIGVTPTECFRVRHTTNEPWQLMHDAIDGFDYRPGHSYELLVRVTPVLHPAADQSDRKYELVRVLTECAHARTPDGLRTHCAASDSPSNGRVQITPKVIAGVILDHIDQSEQRSSGSPAGECRSDTCSGNAPIQVTGRVDFRGGSVQVTVSERGGTEWPGALKRCDRLRDDACREHREPNGDLLISSYALMEPEEDPGIVSETLVRTGEVVVAEFFGPHIDKDPATLDLPVSQAQLRSIVRDPRLRLANDRSDDG